MAEVLGAEVRRPSAIEPGAVAEYELVGFGSGVFGMAPHPELVSFVDRLPHVDDIRGFVFATSGLGRILTRPGTRPLVARSARQGLPGR